MLLHLSDNCGHLHPVLAHPCCMCPYLLHVVGTCSPLMVYVDEWVVHVHVYVLQAYGAGIPITANYGGFIGE